MKIFATHGYKDFVCSWVQRGSDRRYLFEYDLDEPDLSVPPGEREQPHFHGRNPERDWQIHAGRHG